MQRNSSLFNKNNAVKGLIVVWIMILSIFTSCSNPDDDMDPGNDPNNNPDQMMDDEPGDAAPDFSLEGLDGSTVKLSDYENKVVVLFFFGNTCPSCRAVGPDIESKLNKDFSGNADYVILGLDQWDGNSASVQSFKDNTGISFPLLLKASSVAADYGTTYDRLVVIDKSGKVVHKGTSAATNDIGTVKSKVDDLLDDM